MLAIHQPEFLPWMGYFHKMKKSSLFVILDHVQFKKRYFENRNRIVSPMAEVQYIGAPVKVKGRFAQAISDVEIENSSPWQRKFLEKIRHFYASAPYFDLYFDEIQCIVDGYSHGRLIDLNVAFIMFFIKHLGIDTEVKFSSQLDVFHHKSSDLILNICLLMHSKVYLCGASGKDYLRMEDFSRHGVVVDFINYQPPVYSQLCGDYVSHLSTLDLLFNNGPNSADFIGISR